MNTKHVLYRKNKRSGVKEWLNIDGSWVLDSVKCNSDTYYFETKAAAKKHLSTIMDECEKISNLEDETYIYTIKAE